MTMALIFPKLFTCDVSSSFLLEMSIRHAASPQTISRDCSVVHEARGDISEGPRGMFPQTAFNIEPWKMEGDVCQKYDVGHSSMSPSRIPTVPACQVQQAARRAVRVCEIAVDSAYLWKQNHMCLSGNCIELM